jgi:hypothetical protein
MNRNERISRSRRDDWHRFDATTDVPRSTAIGVQLRAPAAAAAICAAVRREYGAGEEVLPALQFAWRHRSPHKSCKSRPKPTVADMTIF